MCMRRFTLTFSVLVLAMVVTMLGPPSSAFATGGPPSTSVYAGRFTRGGLPYSGTTDLVFGLYDTPSGGSPVWSESFGAVVVSGGSFSVVLGQTSALPPVLDGSNLWLQITVDGVVAAARRPVGSSPYAMVCGESSNSATVGGLSTSEIRSNVPGANVVYNPATSGLGTTDVQATLDALAGQVAALQAALAA